MHFWGHGSIQKTKMRCKCHMFNFLSFWHWSTNILSYIINMKNVADLMLVNEMVSPRNANGERIISKPLCRLVLGSSWRSSASSTLAVLCDRGHRVTAPGCHSALTLHTLCSAWLVELERRVCVWRWSEGSHSEWLWEGVQASRGDAPGQEHGAAPAECREHIHPLVQPPCPPWGCPGLCLVCSVPPFMPHGATWAAKPVLLPAVEASTVGERCCKSQSFQSWLWFLTFKAENCICSWRQSAGIKTKLKRLVSKYVRLWPW